MALLLWWHIFGYGQVLGGAIVVGLYNWVDFIIMKG